MTALVTNEQAKQMRQDAMLRQMASFAPQRYAENMRMLRYFDERERHDQTPEGQKAKREAQANVLAFLASPEQQAREATYKHQHIAPIKNVAFALLGLAPSATKQLIRKAYRRKAKEVHPDIGGNAATFRQITDAYHALMYR